MQMQADMLQHPLAVSAFDAVTPYGAALMAGLGAGLWSGLDDLRPLVKPSKQILPDAGAGSRWEHGYADWLAASEALLALYRGKSPSV
jgi:glycerol kinase